MFSPSTILTAAWWNVNDFYHFLSKDGKRVEGVRWPQSRETYTEKCRRVDVALNELFDGYGIPQILCLGEITNEAANELRNRKLPDFRVISLDVKVDDPTLQVAILYGPDTGAIKFVERMPIVVPDTPRGTRPMAVLDIETDEGHVVRIIVCHWQARIDEKGSKRIRYRTADYLSKYTYDFMSERLGMNHVMIIGDLNDEPFDESLAVLNAHRHRGRAQGRKHWTDSDVKRVHLYNTSWRLLGEKLAYPSEEHGPQYVESCAGTYYWESERSWYHFDQIIVSGGLLCPSRPFINEDEVRIVSSPAFLTDGLPVKFYQDGSKFVGLSDHLPLVAKIHI